METMGHRGSSLSLLLISTLFLLLPFIAFANSTPHENFLQCLTLYSQNASSISQVFYTPINSSYSSVLDVSIHNLRFLTHFASKPLVIITPLEVSHIQATVYCSKKHSLQLLVRSGGHDLEGLSYMSGVPFVILDMVNLRAVSVDVENAMAWVESGATLGELYYRIAEKSKTLGFPAGTCPTVGVGGQFSGGGVGTMLRKYGLSVDNILDAHLIDAKGRFHNRKSMGEDLFWAIRGGGGGTFGIVVSWKIKLVPVPETVTVFNIGKTLAQNATKLIYKWQSIAAEKLPYELHMFVTLLSTNDENGNRTIQSFFQTLYLGGIENLLNITSSEFPELGVTKEDCTEMSWIDSILYFATFSGQPLEVLINRSSDTKTYVKMKTDYVKEPIPELVLEQTWQVLFEEDPGIAFMVLYPNGGRMSEISDSALPYPHRAGKLYAIQHIISWTNNSGDASARHIRWIRGLYNFIAPYVSKSPRSAYVNSRDLDIGRNNESWETSYKEAKVWGTKYFNKNFDRLVKVKTVVDPTNFFRNVQSVPPLSSVDPTNFFRNAQSVPPLSSW